MSDLREIILIGDPVEERFNWLKELLYEKYGKEAGRVKTLEEMGEFLDTSPKTVSLVFITDDLPLSSKISKKNPHLNFNTLQFSGKFKADEYVCIVTEKNDPDLEGLRKRPYHVHLRSFPPNPAERQRIIDELGALGSRLLLPLTEISTIAAITVWDKSNSTLKRQIRALSETHELSDGESHLHRLMRDCLDCENAEKIEVKQLGQGKSGASVFRLIISDAGKTSKEYVLKLSNALWKLESEVHGHLEASETHKDGYTRHVAKIREPVVSIKSTEPKEAHNFIVNSGQWYAIHYDFLGGSELGKFIDLETAMIADPVALKDKTKDSLFTLRSARPNKVLEHRLKILSATLDGLCDLWYSKKELGDRRIETVWKIEDAPDREFIPLPPYQLTQRVKGWVQDFLESRESLVGSRLFHNWKQHTESVLKLVAEDSSSSSSSELGALDKEIPFTLSPVHGDLNANNVLLWLKYGYPFLIDLPFYQKDGHALQDFARLETEIKFALMDRQEDSPEDEVIAFDNTISQVPLWIEMEDRLHENDRLDETLLNDVYLEDCVWSSGGFQGNVTLCYKLILLVRKKAFEIQRKILDGKPPPVSFADEYLPALLYHTVRSIGYPSLSIFKRLLAVYSSGLILDKLLKS